MIKLYEKGTAMDIINRNKIIVFGILMIVSVVSSLLVFVLISPMHSLLLSMIMLFTMSVYTLNEFKYALSVILAIFTSILVSLLILAIYYIISPSSDYILSSILFLAIMGGTFVIIRYSGNDFTIVLAEKIFNAFIVSTVKKEVDYKLYKKYAYLKWLVTRKTFIYNLPSYLVVARFFFFSIAVFTSCVLFFSPSSIVFTHAVIYDKILASFVLIYALFICAYGVKFVLPCIAINFFMLSIGYYIYALLIANFAPNLYYELFSVIYSLLMFACLFVAILYVLKRYSRFTDFQIYERNDKYVCVDLYLKDFLPMIERVDIMSFNVSFDVTNNCVTNSLIDTFSRYANYYNYVFAGYETDYDTNVTSIYIYADTDSKKRNALYSKLLKEAEKLNAKISKVIYVKDSSSNCYFIRLYPCNDQLCKIISRIHMDKLIMSGVAIDREYDVSFFINFRDKNDPVFFEKILGYFGFKLSSVLDYQEENSLGNIYKHKAEYVVKAFISPRRMEYLINVILDNCKDFGCCYSGEWKISN